MDCRCFLTRIVNENICLYMFFSERCGSSCYIMTCSSSIISCLIPSYLHWPDIPIRKFLHIQRACCLEMAFHEYIRATVCFVFWFDVMIWCCIIGCSIKMFVPKIICDSLLSSMSSDCSIVFPIALVLILLTGFWMFRSNISAYLIVYSQVRP